MTHSKAVRRGTIAAALSLAAMTMAAPAGAAGHRARLSADLADHLAFGSASIDVIVHGTRAEVDALAAKYNVRVKRYLRTGAVLRVTAGQLAALQQDETQEHLSGDIPIYSTADVTTQSIGADQVWAGAEGLPALSGKGVGVAVIDSGVDAQHNALKGRVTFTKDFTGGDGSDLYGHGTHVASIVAGRIGKTNETSDFRGVASGARIINLRVLKDDGSGMASDVIEAVDFATENRKALGIDVINLSLGAPVTQPYRDDPLCEAVERAVAAGIIVVVAAGNYGIDKEGRQVYGSVATPGNDPSVITVGAVDTHDTAIRSDDTIAKFSSRGPTRYDLVLKPDLVAPGTHVAGAEAAGSYLSKTYPTRHVAGAGANAYIQLSGTSMAAAVVSGSVALLLERRERLAPRDAKTVLQMTSSFMPGAGLVASGAGSLNALSASKLVATRKIVEIPETTIASEAIRPFGFGFTGFVTPQLSLGQAGSLLMRIVTFNSRAPHSRTTQAGVRPTSIFWGQANSIFWGQADSIFWGQADSIFWGQADSIFWGQADSIFWGQADSIFWGQADSIFWGQAESIFWGQADSIFWGQADSIFWGQADSIFWGQANSIFWGQSADDSIFWGQSNSDSIFWGQAVSEAGF
jgi:serine protease AprX